MRVVLSVAPLHCLRCLGCLWVPVGEEHWVVGENELVAKRRMVVWWHTDSCCS